MKIIDFMKKGNVVRFYLGADDLEKWWGDESFAYWLGADGVRKYYFGDRMDAVQGMATVGEGDL